MRVKEMHPLCCITLESAGIGDASPEPALLRTGSAVNLTARGSEPNAGGSDVGTSTSVAGILYKWTNYGKGWRSRWFTLRDNGVLSYSKSRHPQSPPGSDVILIGAAARGVGKHGKSSGIVHLKVGAKWNGRCMFGHGVDEKIELKVRACLLLRVPGKRIFPIQAKNCAGKFNRMYFEENWLHG